MKRSLTIDFATRARPRWAGWALAAAALVLLVSVAAASWRVEQEARELAARVKAAQAARAPRPALSAEDRALLVQARAIASQLNAPWNELLSVFEERSMPSIGLLKLEPDAKAAIVRVTAQASSIEAMVAYLAALESDGRLVDVVLANHQIEREVAGKPVRFTVVASWRLPAPIPPAVTRVAEGSS